MFWQFLILDYFLYFFLHTMLCWLSFWFLYSYLFMLLQKKIYMSIRKSFYFLNLELPVTSKTSKINITKSLFLFFQKSNNNIFQHKFAQSDINSRDCKLTKMTSQWYSPETIYHQRGSSKMKCLFLPWCVKSLNFRVPQTHEKPPAFTTTKWSRPLAPAPFW